MKNLAEPTKNPGILSKNELLLRKIRRVRLDIQSNWNMSFRPLRSNRNRICAGCSHSVFLDSEGKVYSSGCNDEGQVGVPGKDSYVIPQQLKFPNNAVIEQVFCNKGNQNFFVDVNRRVYTCGYIGKENITSPKLVERFLGLEIHEIFCGFSQSFVMIKEPFEVFSVRRDEKKYVSLPVKFLKEGQRLLKISPGNNHTLFLTTLHVYCCGSNHCGQLGKGNYTRSGDVEPVKYFFIHDIKITDVQAGHSHSLFLSDKNKVYSCGSNQHGQLGIGLDEKNEKVSTPTLIKTLEKVEKVRAGHSHSVCLTSERVVYMFGANYFGECVMEGEKKVYVPQILKTNHKVIDIAAGVAFTLFLTNEGYVFGSGLNEDGRLGIGEQKNEDKYNTRMKLSHLKIITFTEKMRNLLFTSTKFVDLKITTVFCRKQQ